MPRVFWTTASRRTTCNGDAWTGPRAPPFSPAPTQSGLVLKGPAGEVFLPARWAENGLPAGVQLVGRIGNDARLMACAAFLEQALAASR